MNQFIAKNGFISKGDSNTEGRILSGGTDIGSLFATAGGGGIYDGSGTVPSSTNVTLTDNINFGSNTLYVDGASGEVGIGTTNPNSKLQVSDTGSIANFGDGTFNHHWINVRGAESTGVSVGMNTSLNSGSGGALIRAGTNKNFGIAVNNASDFSAITESDLALIIETNGNVGIGTTSPSGLTHFYGASPDVYIESSDDTTSEIYLKNTTVEWRLQTMSVANGNLFQIRDNTNGIVPFRIEPNSFTNCLRLNTTEAVFNEGGNLYDFRVEGSTDANLFFVDASTDNVGIGTATPEWLLHAKNSGTTLIKSEASNDSLAGYVLENTVNEWRLTVEATSGLFKIQDTTNGLTPMKIVSSVPSNTFRLNGTEAVFNEDGNSYDFRVEGDTDANLIFADASTDFVGVGTATPDAKFNVLTDNAQTMIGHFQGTYAGYQWLRVERTGEATIDLAAGAGINGGGLVSSDALRFSTNGASLTNASMYIETDGSVGIGTTSPSEKLHVSGSGGTYIEISDSNNHAGLKINGFTGFDSYLFFEKNNTAKWSVFNDESAGDNFRIYNYTSALTSILVDATTNNVGIGTTSPAEKLHVSGSGGTNIEVSDSTSAARVIINGATGFDSQLQFQESGANRWQLFNDANVGDDFKIYNYATAAAVLTVDGATDFVGIGTTSPDRLLHLSNSGGQTIMEFQRTDGTADKRRFGIVQGSSYLGFNSRLDTDALNVSIMNLQSDGKVGIGTATPAEKLHVAGSGGTNIEVSDSTGMAKIHVNGATGFDAQIRLQEAGADRWALYNDASTGDDFKIYNYATALAALTIDGSSNVGIGTTSPSVKLDVIGEGTFRSMGVGSFLTLKSSNGTNSTGHTGIKFISDVDSRTSEIVNYRETSSQASSLLFKTYNSGVVDALKINYDGKVGIGTTSPQEKFHVQGTARIGASTANNADMILKGNTTPAVTVGGSTSAAILTTAGDNGGSFHVGIEVPSNDVNDGFYIATDSDQDGVVDTVAMKINAAGNVGIGTTGPASKLDIESTASALLRMTRSTNVVGYELGTDSVGLYDYTNARYIYLSDISAAEFVINEGGESYDFRVEGNTDVNLIFADASTDRVGIGTSSPSALLDVDGSAIFNESGADVNFRVESDGSTNMLFVDGGTNRVGIGTGAPSSRLHVWDGASIVETRLDGNGGSTLSFYSAGFSRASIDYVQSTSDLTIDNGANDIVFKTGTGGSSTENMRIESNGNVGIGTDTPDETLDVHGEVEISGTTSGATVFNVLGSAGQLFSVTDNLVGDIFSVNDISGAPILTVNSNDRVEVNGSLLMNTLISTGLASGTHTCGSFDSTLGQAAYFDYYVMSGTTLRAGTVTSVWDGTSTEYTDNSTEDLGGLTTGVTFSVDISGGDVRFRAVVDSGTWTVKTGIRII